MFAAQQQIDNLRAHAYTPQSVGAKALHEDAGAECKEDDARLALELRREGKHPGEQDVVQLEAVTLVEREGSVQEGVRHDQPAAHIVYSVLRTYTTYETKQSKDEEKQGGGQSICTVRRDKWIGGAASEGRYVPGAECVRV